VQACGGLINSTGEGSAHGMSGDDGALPTLDDRTHQLIASLIEISVSSALAARAAPSLRDGSGPAVRGPLTESEAILDPATAAISAGTGDASVVPVKGGGPGNTHGPRRPNKKTRRTAKQKKLTTPAKKTALAVPRLSPQGGMKRAEVETSLRASIIPSALTTSTPSRPRPNLWHISFPDLRIRERVGW
jgi:hypothetical protein